MRIRSSRPPFSKKLLKVISLRKLYVLKSVIPIISQYLMPSSHLAAMNVLGVHDCWVTPRMYEGMLEALSHDPEAILTTEAIFNDLAAAYLSLPYPRWIWLVPLHYIRVRQCRAEKILRMSIDRIIILYPSTVAGYTTREYVSLEECIMNAIRNDPLSWEGVLSIPRKNDVCRRWLPALTDMMGKKN